jgi:DNA-binding transcriptional MocR family regulator
MAGEEPKSVKKINPFRLFTGAMVPEWLMVRTEVSPGAKLAYARLARYAGQKGVAFPRLERLGSDLGVSRDQARRYVAELVKHGLITSKTGGFHRANRYHFLDHEWMSKRGGKSATPRGSKSATPPLYEVSKESHKDRKRVTGQAGAAQARGLPSADGPQSRKVLELLKGVTQNLSMK